MSFPIGDINYPMAGRTRHLKWSAISRKKSLDTLIVYISKTNKTNQNTPWVYFMDIARRRSNNSLSWWSSSCCRQKRPCLSRQELIDMLDAFPDYFLRLHIVCDTRSGFKQENDSYTWLCFISPLHDDVHNSQCYPGYFREPHWNSMGLPEISRVTWQLWMLRS